MRRVSLLEKRLKKLRREFDALALSCSQLVTGDQVAELEKSIDALGESTAPAVLKKMVVQQNQMILDMVAMRTEIDTMSGQFKRYKNAAAINGITIDSSIA